MKKLILFSLLLTSFSAHSLSIEMPVPCIDGNDIIKHLEDKLEELTKLSNSDKDNLTYKNQIDELQVDIYELVAKLCKKSPEGNLVDDKREGVWTWYDEYNNPAKFGNYKNGLKEGLWIERHTNSNLETQMYYKNDVLDGKYTIYGYMSPFDVIDIQIRKAELEAKLESAKLQGFQDLVNHFTEQLETLDYPKIITEGYYVNGKRDGYWKELKGGGNYINGVKDGAWDEGSSKGNYINGNKDGTWSYSYSFGEVYKEEIYEDGVLIKKKFL